MATDEEQVATKRDLSEVESRLVKRIDDVETRLAQRMESLFDTKLEALETHLLTAFERWAVPVNGRVRKLEVTDGVT